MGDQRRWARAAGVMWRNVLDDVVVLAPGTPDPFALAGGAALWAALEAPGTPAELAAASGSADPAGAEAVASLLADLAARGAVEPAGP